MSTASFLFHSPACELQMTLYRLSLELTNLFAGMNQLALVLICLYMSTKLLIGEFKIWAFSFREPLQDYAVVWKQTFIGLFNYWFVKFGFL